MRASEVRDRQRLAQDQKIPATIRSIAITKNTTSAGLPMIGLSSAGRQLTVPTRRPILRPVQSRTASRAPP